MLGCQFIKLFVPRCVCLCAVYHPSPGVFQKYYRNMVCHLAVYDTAVRMWFVSANKGLV
jgi:hypothetical protein